MAKKLNKSAVVRDTLAKLGVDAESDEVRAAIVKAHPGLAEWVKTPAFGNYLSGSRKKLKGGTSEKAATATTRTRRESAEGFRKVAAPQYVANLPEQLETLKTLVDVHGADNVKKFVDLM